MRSSCPAVPSREDEVGKPAGTVADRRSLRQVFWLRTGQGKAGRWRYAASRKTPGHITTVYPQATHNTQRHFAAYCSLPAALLPSDTHAPFPPASHRQWVRDVSPAGMFFVHHSGASAAESHRLPLPRPITVATGSHAPRGPATGSDRFQNCKPNFARRKQRGREMGLDSHLTSSWALHNVGLNY